MIASHLAAGGSFCCKANDDARALVTKSKRKQDLLAEHAYEAWGCYGDAKEPAGSGTGSSSFAGQGPYFWVTPGLEHTAGDTASKREHELKQARKRFQDFLEDIAPRPAITMDAYLKAKRTADNFFNTLDALNDIVNPRTVN